MKEKWEALRKKYWPPGKDQFLIMALCGLLLAVIAVPVDSGKQKGVHREMWEKQSSLRPLMILMR